MFIWNFFPSEEEQEEEEPEQEEEEYGGGGFEEIVRFRDPKMRHMWGLWWPRCLLQLLHHNCVH